MLEDYPCSYLTQECMCIYVCVYKCVCIFIIRIAYHILFILHLIVYFIFQMAVWDQKPSLEVINLLFVSLVTDEASVYWL